MTSELNQIELREINGGHDGEVYDTGVKVGKALTKIGVVLGVIGFLISL